MIPTGAVAKRMTRRVIIGYDGTGNSPDALALGASLAPALAADALVVSAVPYLDHLISGEELEQSTRAEAQRIDDAARRVLPGLEVETRAVPDGSPARALNELVEDEPPLALVIGSARRGTLGRILVGSAGSALLSGASCAVAVAPRGYSEDGHGKLLGIAVAINGSEESRTALRTGIALAERLNASLAVFTVAEPVRYGYAVPFSVVDTRVLTKEIREQAERTLDRAIDSVPTGVPVERRLLTGSPAETIAAATADRDLLIVGSRGYGPVRRTLLGGVSAELARTAECPLLVLPRGAGGDPLRLGELERGAAGRAP